MIVHYRLLDYNNITTISKGLLFGLSSLTHLSLSQNQIDSVRPDAWEPTKHLKTLWVFFWMWRCFKKLYEQYLYLVKEDKISDSWFLFLFFFYRDLSNNRLVSLREGTFRALGALTDLTLSHNHLAHIERDSFAPTSSLLTLWVTLPPLLNNND